MKTIERVCFAAGALLFGALLYRVGLATLAKDLRRIGWGFSWILAQHLVGVSLNSLAWRSAIPRISRPSFPALSKILVAADGFNAVAPSAVIGGELIRVSLLRRTVRGTTAAASVILAAATQFLAQVLFILIGAPILLGGSLHRPFRNTLILLQAGFLLILAGALVLAVLGNPFQRLRRLLLRVGIGGKGSMADASAWRCLDAEIFGAFRKRPGDLLRSLLLFFLGWASGAIEIYLLLQLLGSRADWKLCLTIQVLSTLVDGAFFFVPAKIGTQEAGLYAIFLFLGLNPALGFAAGIARRLRETAWAGAGLALLGSFQRAGNARTAVSRAALP